MIDELKNIERYLAGEMSSSEVEAFEKRLKSDPALKEELNLAREMHGYLRRRVKKKKALDALHEVHRQFSGDEKNQDKPETDWKSAYLWVLLVFAMIILAIAIFYQPDKQELPVRNRNLYAQNFDPGVVSFGIRSNTGDSLLQLAELAYNRKSFEEAINHFENYRNTSEDQDSEVLFYEGVAQLALENTEIARQLFALVRLNTAVFDNDVFWYTALAYVLEGRNDLAVEQLESITESSVLYAEAERLKERLEGG